MPEEVTRLSISEAWLVSGCLLAEGPLYDAAQEAILFVDIKRKQIHVAEISHSKAHKLIQLEDAVGVMAQMESSDEQIIVAAKRGFATLTLADGELTYVKRVYENDPAMEEQMRFNDGVVDSKGRFWAGTMADFHASDVKRQGTLFRYDPDGSLHVMIEHAICPNGMGWSPDRRIFYYTDSGDGTIYAYDYEEQSGQISNRRVFLEVDEPQLPGAGAKPVPDGCAIDAMGGLWIALWNGGKVIHVSPSGEKLGEIHFPALKITCPAFGGRDFDELFVTTAALDDEEAEAKKLYRGNGDVYRVKAGVKGLPRHKFGA